MGKLDGKVAIVTGASSGMGAAQARLFVREGARVVLADLNDEGHLLAEELGHDAVFVQHDVGRADDWSKLVAITERSFGLPTILVNTAGVVLRKSFVDTTPEDFERLFRTNQLGTFLGIRAVVDPMTRAGGGAIVNVSSVGGLRGLAGYCAYSSTKWGVRGISQAAALELAPLNIRVNTLFPGPIDTPMTHATITDVRDQITASLPAGRFGTADEVARATLFLLSDDASFVFGAELAVDGGQRA